MRIDVHSVITSYHKKNAISQHTLVVEGWFTKNLEKSSLQANFRMEFNQSSSGKLTYDNAKVYGDPISVEDNTRIALEIKADIVKFVYHYLQNDYRKMTYEFLNKPEQHRTKPTVGERLRGLIRYPKADS